MVWVHMVSDRRGGGRCRLCTVEPRPRLSREEGDADEHDRLGAPLAPVVSVVVTGDEVTAPQFPLEGLTVCGVTAIAKEGECDGPQRRIGVRARVYKILDLVSTLIARPWACGELFTSKSAMFGSWCKCL